MTPTATRMKTVTRRKCCKHLSMNRYKFRRTTQKEGQGQEMRLPRTAFQLTYATYSFIHSLQAFI